MCAATVATSEFKIEAVMMHRESPDLERWRCLHSDMFVVAVLVSVLLCLEVPLLSRCSFSQLRLPLLWYPNGSPVN